MRYSIFNHAINFHTAIPKTNPFDLLIGIVGIVLLVSFKKIGRKYKITIPGALVVVALGTLIAWAGNLHTNV